MPPLTCANKAPEVFGGLVKAGVSEDVETL